ncbi:trimethyllysine dioxygenase [Umbelopsis sp. PMI_123]|nr:trimethyllysine dioxygenase [Umbelopsis sp. PMI_123]
MLSRTFRHLRVSPPLKNVIPHISTATARPHPKHTVPFHQTRISALNICRSFSTTKIINVQQHFQVLANAVDGNQVQVQWDANTGSLYQNVWLRDHCRCPKCYHPQTRQRLVNTFAIPVDIKPRSVQSDESGLTVVWDNDEHKSVYEWTWLKNHSYNPPLEGKGDLTSPKPILWDASIAKAPPIVPYEDVMTTKAGLAKWLNNIEVYGFSFVDGVPISLEATEQLARHICFIRESHYSPGLWDFTSDLAHADTAYTDLALNAHTDTTYFSDPVGLQMFHKLEFDGTGGESLLVDGFKVAQNLKENHPEAYETLSNLRIPTHSAGDEKVMIVPTPRENPILNHLPDGSLYQIRYNNDDRSTLSNLTSKQVDQFYDALRKWNEELTSERNQYWEGLEPGRVVVFDNWRVLHGRASFTGHRRLCGAYLNRDDFKSRVRSIKYTPEEKAILL